MRHAFTPLIRSALVSAVLLTGCGGDGDSSRGGESSPERTPPGETPAGVAATQGEPRQGSEGSAAPGELVELARVVVLGTSLTAGLGLSDPEEQSWAGVLGERAREEGFPVEVVNAGVSGDTSAGGLRRLEWLLREPVDVLVVELGANDGLRGLSLEELEENLREIIARTREAWPEARIVLAGMEAPPNMGQDYVTGFRSLFIEVARDEGVALIPFLLEGVAAVPSLNQADGIHPTVEGHRRMADTAWPAVEAALREVTGS